MVLIKLLNVTPFQQNARILVDKSTGSCVVIDPGGEAERIFAEIEQGGYRVEGVFLTHAHLDHAGGVTPFLKLCEEKFNSIPPLTACGEEERHFREHLSEQGARFGFSGGEFQNVPEPDRIVVDGDEVSVGKYRAKVLFTPGHSPGHLALFFESCSITLEHDITREVEAPLLIAGDTLFAGSIGRTDLPGGDYETLITSIREKILTLPDETIVLSGHGPDTTVGDERKMNPFLQ